MGVGRHNVEISGNPDGQPMLLAHGFGCDQNMWRFVAPAFEDTYKVVAFDYAGAGGADPDLYSPDKYDSLDAYASDVLDICREHQLEKVVFVGHSVSGMVGALAAIREPERFDKLIMVSPSPRYMNDEGYTGGFDPADIEELLASLESNYLGWSSAMAPVIMGNPDRPELGQELTESFCRTNPEAARQFARVTFLSDNRADLDRIPTPTLVLQCTDDVIAPVSVGEYVSRSIPQATLTMLEATGHCPHLSAPDQTIEAMRAFLA